MWVGEVRGEEAVDRFQALNTGHDGSLSTGHANSSRDMLSRLETMVLMGIDLPLEAVRRQIASGVDILIHLGRAGTSPEKFWRSQRCAVMKKGISEYSLYISGRRKRDLYRWQNFNIMKN